MNKNIIVLLAIIVIGGVIFLSFSKEKEEINAISAELTQETMTEAETVENEDLIPSTKDDALPEVEALEKEVPPIVSTGVYEDYSPDKVLGATTANIVIFFHASWCPSCRVLATDIEKNVSSIPTDLTILKADYDKETELKKKYGVTSQHTFVQIDKNGNMIKKWSGGSKLENIVGEVQ
jgi:thioredoxin 1